MRRIDQSEARLAHVPLFKGFSKRDLRLLARMATYATCRAGDVLISEGRHGSELFVIVSGEADVSRDGVTLNTLEPGDYFGELAVLNPAPRTATVTAKTEMGVLVITPRELAILLSDVPLFARKLLSGMAGHIQQSARSTAAA